MKTIEVSTSINANVNRVWECFTDAKHITKWNFASDEWHCPSASNPLEVGKQFNWRMEAKDGSMSFDFSGVYNLIEPGKRIEYSLLDGRKVEVLFSMDDDEVKVVERFEA